MKCLKVDLKKVRLTQTSIWNVWWQFGVDIKNTTRKFNVTKHYMPAEEQDKLINYMLKNYKKLKEYRYKTKKTIQKEMAWERLAYFPSSVMVRRQ